MSLTFLAVAESSGKPSPRLCMNPLACEHGRPSIVSGSTIPKPCSCRGCSGEKSTALPSITTSAPSDSTQRLGWDQSSASWGDGRAKATASRVLARAWKTSGAVLLLKSSGLFAYFDRASSSWKMCQESLLPPETGWDSSPTRWPNSAMTCDGQTWQLPTLGKRTNGKGSGSWPTLTAADVYTANLKSSQHKEGSRYSITLGQFAGSWASVRTSDTNGPGLHGDGGLDLRTQAQAWATVTASAGDKNGGMHRGKEDTLDSQTKKWATARANDYKSGEAPAPAQDVLNGQATLWSRQEETTTQPGNRSSVFSSILNPRFAEWLLGWPIGLTELESSATAWITSARKQRRKRSLKASK